MHVQLLSQNIACGRQGYSYGGKFEFTITLVRIGKIDDLLHQNEPVILYRRRLYLTIYGSRTDLNKGYSGYMVHAFPS